MSTNILGVAQTAIHVALGFYMGNSAEARAATRVTTRLNNEYIGHLKWLGEDEIDKYGGHTGASAMCAASAVKLLEITDRLAKIKGGEIEWPGVFDYEVAEAVGEHLRDTAVGSLCYQHEAWLTEQIDNFLHPGPEDCNTHITRDAIAKIVAKELK